MKKLVGVLLLFLLVGCFTEDTTDEVCSLDCTTISGRFVTTDGQGLPDVNLSFQYESGFMFLFYKRFIADLTTDSNGYFHHQFYVKPEELDPEKIGHFELIPDVNSLNIREDIITPDLISYLNLNKWVKIQSRDAVIEVVYNLPKKRWLVVNLNNFIPEQEGDYFSVRSVFPYGLKNEESYDEVFETEFNLVVSKDLFKASNLNNAFKVLVAEGEINRIEVAKMKGGEYSAQNIMLEVGEGDLEEITLEY
ncbi:hypothetical protein [Aestuariibaculum suncheonense]|uniref:Carboxypeptidase regulatory-like domain-containing protein n=1 Tax=Aestuariibaculum suncheonense TaxID=1028745 RepID=A0A8J6UC16_9FLAO|nr:hypothetical protein [Aestuariibaculum suncheonense]MBD0836295.1 hypothetical protein [Aestuariibaculum suncheonense]